MIARSISTLFGVACLFGSVGLAAAQPACFEARRKIDEAGALRYQARQEALAGDRHRVCDTLDEATDRYNDARDILEDCGRTVVAIGLRSELRQMRDLKRFHACD